MLFTEQSLLRVCVVKTLLIMRVVKIVFKYDTRARVICTRAGGLARIINTKQNVNKPYYIIVWEYFSLAT